MQRNVVFQRRPAVLSRVVIATNSRTTPPVRVTSKYVQRTSSGSRTITVDMMPYGTRTRVAVPHHHSWTGLIIPSVRRLLSWLERKS